VWLRKIEDRGKWGDKREKTTTEKERGKMNSLLPKSVGKKATKQMYGPTTKKREGSLKGGGAARIDKYDIGEDNSAKDTA